MNGASLESSFIITTDGVRIYCETCGSGESLLVVPNGICYSGDFGSLAGHSRVVYYDVRNRGRSDSVTDETKLERGILNDVDDLDIVRRHFRADRIDLLGHSYVGLTVLLYAMKYPQHTGRVVQIGPVQPRASTQYPAHLCFKDGKLEQAFQEIGSMQGELAALDPIEACRRFWEVLRVTYVADPKNASRIDWMRCELDSERNFLKYWAAHIGPSIQRLQLEDQDFANVTAPVLTIHGTKDRNAPYGGGREWALRLPDARLLTIPDAAHAPWIESPEMVLGAIETFLEGRWPEPAEKVTR